MDKPYYSTADAAEYLGIKVPSVKYHVRKGHLVPIMMGHSWLFMKDELDRFASIPRKTGRPVDPKSGHQGRIRRHNARIAKDNKEPQP